MSADISIKEPLHNRKRTLYALVDCNNFFVSCERVFAPHLQRRPTLVLSSNDGCVIARSKEVKDIGIPMGIPHFKIKELIKSHNIAIFSSNFSLYRDMSERVMGILEDTFDAVYKYSIDEAFIDISDETNPADAMKRIQEKIAQYCGIPVSVGIASTKTLAKLAGNVAKKSNEGIFYIDSEERRIECLRNHSVGQVWGIGRNITQKLEALGVSTAHHYQTLERSWIQKNFGVGGVRILEDLQGTDSVSLHGVDAVRKSIISSRSFGKATDNLHIIKESLTHHVTSAVRQLRKEKLCARYINVYMKTSRHTDNVRAYDSDSVSFEVATQDMLQINTVTMKLATKMYQKNILYAKSGISIGGLVPEELVTSHNIFNEETAPMKELYKKLDYIVGVYGDSSIQIGSQGFSGSWRANSRFISPAYTTKPSDIAICY